MNYKRSSIKKQKNLKITHWNYKLLHQSYHKIAFKCFSNFYSFIIWDRFRLYKKSQICNFIICLKTRLNIRINNYLCNCKASHVKRFGIEINLVLIHLFKERSYFLGLLCTFYRFQLLFPKLYELLILCEL